MKLTKIIAGIAASAVAASTIAVAASANCLTKMEGTDPALSTGEGMWLYQLYNKGNEDEGKPATKLDIDYSKIAALTFTFSVNEEDQILWDGTIGGSVVFSCNGEKLGVQNDPDPEKLKLFNKYNWPGCEYWGVVDEALEISTNPNADDDETNDKPGIVEKVGDYTYSITNNILVNPITAGDAASIEDMGCMQVGLQEWGSGIAAVTVKSLEVKDADGNVLVTIDELGAATYPSAEAPTDEPTDEPTTGDSTKPSTNTGVESVALVAGVAVLATGAVIVAKKRK